MSKETVDLLEADEHEVKEVRCSSTGIPIPSIPNWYAQVNVNFVSDHARSKSSTAAAQAANLLRLAELDKEEEAEEERDEISLAELEEEELSVDDIDGIEIGDDPEDSEED
ncbi:MAG: hypothetical protein NTX57_00765 [Armatimonadetes bacterium]|jgi:hypothetical protein|nr:hypothetical protein [Armatimonadota bacterium]